MLKDIREMLYWWRIVEKIDDYCLIKKRGGKCVLIDDGNK